MILTDGACEETGSSGALCGIGGCLFDKQNGLFLFFRLLLPAQFARRVVSGSGNPIHQLELLPVLVAFRIWRAHLAGRPVLSFLDNDGARAALVAGHSANPISCAIVNAIGDESAAVQCSPWYDRVASPANGSDAPSRGLVPSSVRGFPEPRETKLALALLSSLEVFWL